MDHSTMAEIDQGDESTFFENHRVHRPIDKNHSLINVPSITNMNYTDSEGDTSSSYTESLMADDGAADKGEYYSNYRKLDMCAPSESDDDERWSELIRRALAGDFNLPADNDKAEKKSVEAKQESRIDKVFETKNNSVKVTVNGITMVDYKGVVLNKKWVQMPGSSDYLNYTCLYQKYYIGMITETKAVETCKKRGQWHMYHKIPLGLNKVVSTISDAKLYPSDCNLHIVYRRNSNGDHVHFVIRRIREGVINGGCIFVDYGDDKLQTFANSGKLLQYYDNFCYMKHDYSNNACKVDVEVFPLWRRRSYASTISAMSSITSEDQSWIPDDSVFDATRTSSSSYFSSSNNETDCNI